MGCLPAIGNKEYPVKVYDSSPKNPFLVLEHRRVTLLSGNDGGYCVGNGKRPLSTAVSHFHITPSPITQSAQSLLSTGITEHTLPSAVKVLEIPKMRVFRGATAHMIDKLRLNHL